MGIDVRSQFKTLNENKNLVYLDSAATTLKPQGVSERVKRFLDLESANVHRGAHSLSDSATELFEASRKSTAELLNATTPNEIIFTRGTTESINLVASELESLGVSEGGALLLTEMEHHSNIVPWQKVAQKLKLEIRVLPVLPDGRLDMEKLPGLVDEKLKMTSLVHVSNALGTVNDIQTVVSKVKEVSSLVLLDCAQSVALFSLDVQKMGVDFLAFSSHKLFGPFGVGVLWGKESLLNSMSPYQCGGSMIDQVDFSGTTYLDTPHRFEAGTPNISGVIGFGEALHFFKSLALDEVVQHEQQLLYSAYENLQNVGGIKIYTPVEDAVNVLSFAVEGAHHSDVGFILNKENVAVRTGHHCAQPLMKSLGIKGTVRASFSIYNNQKDVDRFIEAVNKAKDMLL